MFRVVPRATLHLVFRRSAQDSVMHLSQKKKPLATVASLSSVCEFFQAGEKSLSEEKQKSKKVIE